MTELQAVANDWQNGDYIITTDPARFDLAAIHAFLSKESYWAKNIPFDLMRRSIDQSLCFSLRKGNEQIGFARVITDYATFAYLCDVYVVPAHRGRGLARWMMQCCLAHPELQGLRRWCLFTHDAHPLYRALGFTSLDHPDRAMEMRVVRRYPG